MFKMNISATTHYAYGTIFLKQNKINSRLKQKTHENTKATHVKRKSTRGNRKVTHGFPGL